MPDDLPIYSGSMLRTRLQFADLERLKGADLTPALEKADAFIEQLEGGKTVRLGESDDWNHGCEHRFAPSGPRAILRFARTPERIQYGYCSSSDDRNAAARECDLQHHQEGDGSACRTMIDIRGKPGLLRSEK